LKDKALPSFWRRYNKLPVEIQELARARYCLWRKHPFHAALHFKEVRRGIWSVRINQNYRALGQEEGGRIVWYWIGTHDDYDIRI
jgi:hypothetical protein